MIIYGVGDLWLQNAKSVPSRMYLGQFQKKKKNMGDLDGTFILPPPPMRFNYCLGPPPIRSNY